MDLDTKYFMAKVGTGFLLFSLTIFGIGRGCNSYFNDKTQNTQSHYTVSKPTGISGHTEYTRYKDGGVDVKVYPNFGHRYFDSKFYQDINGDGKVDRIRISNGEVRGNSLNKILDREYDYNQNKVEFNGADSLVLQLSKRM
ncbi:MAG: hypothetical protein WC755_03045 [Candidatus Woesearchaeota archaeon]|jgi:hypothetical protein